MLLKLTTENTFMFISHFYKQTDGCTMGGPLSVIFSVIYVTMSNYLSKPKIYTRLVHDIINRRNKNQPDDSFQKYRINSSGKTREFS